MRIVNRVKPQVTCPHCGYLCKIDEYTWTIDCCKHLVSWEDLPTQLKPSDKEGYAFYFTASVQEEGHQPEP